MLPVKHCKIITVVKPLAANPIIFWIKALTLKTIATKNITQPNNVTICIGNEVKDVILVIAYLISDEVDHLEEPISLALTSYSISIVLKPIHEESALKNVFFSGMFKSTLTALRSNNLKSDDRLMSICVALLIKE